MTENRRTFIRRSCNTLIFLTALLAAVYGQNSKIPTPSEFLGIHVGADRTLADYKQIASYFNMLSKSSKRLEVEILGATTFGNEMFMAVISSEENLKKKKIYKDIARKLADPRGLSQSEIDDLVHQGKTIVLVTCNIHSTEIAATQMAMEWAHALVTAQDTETGLRLENAILLLVPSINPDGQIMEVEWYRKYLGTPFEGGRMPWLYHPYVGHDNNRDWFMLTQKETKIVNHAVYFDWFPQVWLDEHQMGTTGPRLFVPPYSNPVAANVHPLIWRAVDNIGSTMSWRLEEQNKSGVVYGATFDAYWPGGTKNTGWWKNVTGLLTEAASVRLATPLEVSASDLSGGGKGLVEYRRQTNFPNPWRGGVWRLRDIMDYERIASDALLEVCASHREDFLRSIAVMAMDAVKQGKPGEYYKISMNQRDPATASRLARIIQENGAEVYFSATDKSFYMATAQPYARFLSELLGTQRYPKVKLTAGSGIIPPYDVTAWSLPLMMGVDVGKVILSDERQTLLKPLSENDGPEGSVTTTEASLFAVPHECNNATRLINDVLKHKGAISATRTGFTAEGKSFPAGTLLVEPLSDMPALAQKYKLQITGLSTHPAVLSDKLQEVRLGLYKPWVASIDEGWTRWLLEQYNFPFKNIDTKYLKTGKLSNDFDVILLPDISKEIITEGKYKREEGEMKYFQELPPEYSGGIGKEGVKNLTSFVEKGGTLIALASACGFIIDEFNVPVSNIFTKTRNDEFQCPGSLLNILIDPTHPVTYGMPSSAAAFIDGRIAFQTTLPGSELTRQVLAWYPEDAEDILLSGWIQGAEKLQRKAAAVALSYGKGKIVLLGFRVQHRAQTEGTFKLLFNAIQWGGMTEDK